MLKVFSVYDSKVCAYMPPIFFRTAGEAVRAFEHSINNADSMFNKNPEDFTIFELGNFDELTAKFDMHVSPVSFGTALEMMSRQKS